MVCFFLLLLLLLRLLFSYILLHVSIHFASFSYSFRIGYLLLFSEEIEQIPIKTAGKTFDLVTFRIVMKTTSLNSTATNWTNSIATAGFLQIYTSASEISCNICLQKRNVLHISSYSLVVLKSLVFYCG